jgi:hypothetical protein
MALFIYCISFVSVLFPELRAKYILDIFKSTVKILNVTYKMQFPNQIYFVLVLISQGNLPLRASNSFLLKEKTTRLVHLTDYY